MDISVEGHHMNKTLTDLESTHHGGQYYINKDLKLDILMKIQFSYIHINLISPNIKGFSQN